MSPPRGLVSLRTTVPGAGGSSARSTCAPSTWSMWAGNHPRSLVTWTGCGHAQEIILFPLADGGCQFVPVPREAR